MVATEVTGSDGEAVGAVEKMASKGTIVYDSALEAKKNRKGRAHPEKQLTKTASEMLLSKSGNN